MAKKFAKIIVDGTELLRNDWIRELFNDGLKRKDIAEMVGVRYQVVYAATKGMENVAHNSTTTGRNILLIAEDGTTQSRQNIIRDRYLKGETRSEIAKSLSVRYQIVYAATKNIAEWQRETTAEVTQEMEAAIAAAEAAVAAEAEAKAEAAIEAPQEEVEPVEETKPKAKRTRKPRKALK